MKLPLGSRTRRLAGGLGNSMRIEPWFLIVIMGNLRGGLNQQKILVKPWLLVAVCIRAECHPD
jgi:hypothetical protein